MDTQKTPELAKALASAQAEFKAPPKDKKVSMILKTGAKKEYAYADLATVIATNQSVLAKFGLSISHQIDEHEKGTILRTELLHSSGENRVSTMWLPSYSGPQDLGSLLTYYRRYAVSAMLGVAADEDDDGGAAQSNTTAGPPRSASPVKAKSNSTAQMLEEVKHEMTKLGLTKEQVQGQSQKMYGKSTVSDLSVNELIGLKATLKDIPSFDPDFANGDVP
jgi:hypothetical protein